jgi:hypothetical protein
MNKLSMAMAGISSAQTEQMKAFSTEPTRGSMTANTHTKYQGWKWEHFSANLIPLESPFGSDSWCINHLHRRSVPVEAYKVLFTSAFVA